MKWVAGVAILVGGVLVVVGIKNTGGDICQVLTGKPCPTFTSSSTSTSSTVTAADCAAIQALPGFSGLNCNALFPPPLAPGGKPKVSGGPTVVPDPTFHEQSFSDRLNMGMLR
jgi:hypothetical protein